MSKLKDRYIKIKEYFSNLPVKSKLMLIILSVTITCILLTVLAFSVYGVVNIRKQMQDELAITGTIIGNRINAALVFNNNSVALESLNALSANNSIQLACVYDQSNKIFAKYFSGKRAKTDCPKALTPQIFFEKNRLKLYREINDSFDNSVIGTLYIESNLSRVSSYMVKQSFIAIAIIFIALIIGFILARKLQNIISAPINSLVTSNHAGQYLSQGSNFSGNELTKLDMLIGAMYKKVKSLENQVHIRDKQLTDIARNSESTFDYLSNELKQPLEATLAFGDIISSKAIGDIDGEYVSYYNDVYLNVFYYYGIINDTMAFYKDHMHSAQNGKTEVHPLDLIDNALNEIKNNKPEFMESFNFSYNVMGQEDIPKMILDEIIVKEVFTNLSFIYTKYLSFLDKNDFRIEVSAKIDETDQDAKKFRIETTCPQLIEENIANILENHRDYQNDVHLLRAKLQYLKYLTSYAGGYLDYGNDLRCLSKIVLLFPIKQLVLDEQPLNLESMAMEQLGSNQ